MTILDPFVIHLNNKMLSLRLHADIKISTIAEKCVVFPAMYEIVVTLFIITSLKLITHFIRLLLFIYRSVRSNK